MIVVVLQNPNPEDPKRQNNNLEVRMMIEGITLEEADQLGDAIHIFAVALRRRHVMKAFQATDEQVKN
jgi:hypothetical protein